MPYISAAPLHFGVWKVRPTWRRRHSESYWPPSLPIQMLLVVRLWARFVSFRSVIVYCLIRQNSTCSSQLYNACINVTLIAIFTGDLSEQNHISPSDRNSLIHQYQSVTYRGRWFVKTTRGISVIYYACHLVPMSTACRAVSSLEHDGRCVSGDGVQTLYGR